MTRLLAKSWKIPCSQIPWGWPEVLSSMLIPTQARLGGEEVDPVVEGSQDRRSAWRSECWRFAD